MQVRSRFLAAISIAMLVAGCGRETPPPDMSQSMIALSDRYTGDFELTDIDGETRADEEFEGRVMLVYFGFTNCPDVCPGDVAVMSAALNALGPDADDIAPIFISVDPERDTPDALRAYFGFDDRIIPLTGSVEAADAARAGFVVYASKVPTPESALEYTVQHQRMFFLTDRKGQPQFAVPGGVTAAELTAILTYVLDKFQ